MVFFRVCHGHEQVIVVIILVHKNREWGPETVHKTGGKKIPVNLAKRKKIARQRRDSIGTESYSYMQSGVVMQQ